MKNTLTETPESTKGRKPLDDSLRRNNNPMKIVANDNEMRIIRRGAMLAQRPLYPFIRESAIKEALRLMEENNSYE